MRSAARQRSTWSKARGTGRGSTSRNSWIAWPASCAPPRRVPGARSAFRTRHLAVTTNVDIPSAAHVPVARSRAVPHERASTAWRLAPLLLASAIGLAHLIVQPRTVDLAAAVFRSRLFAEAGFTIGHNSWYTGHPMWSYSVLLRPLAWLLSP